jgi:hypothetical protein
MDVVPPPGPSIEARPAAEPVAEDEAESVVDSTPEPIPQVEAEPETKVEAEAEAEAGGEAIPEPASQATAEPEHTQEQEDGVAPSERRDSGKDIELELPSRELQSVPEHMSELEAEFSPQPQGLRPAAREADSGFWDGPDAETSKEPSIAEIREPASTLVPTAEPVHELESNVDPKEGTSVHIRDFAGSEEPVSDAVAENTPGAAADAQPEPTVEQVEDKSADATTQIPAAEGEPKEAKGKEVEAEPETTEKVEPFRRGQEQGCLLTVQQAQEESVEPKVVAKVEPEPEKTSSDEVPVPDDAQPAGSAETKAAEPNIEPGTKPPREPAIHRAYTDSAILAAAGADDAAESPAVLGAQPAADQDGAKTDADAAGNQPCSAQVRQKGWKKRFMSLRYPLMFGRGM